jgi:hypothetical protein
MRNLHLSNYAIALINALPNILELTFLKEMLVLKIALLL